MTATSIPRRWVRIVIRLVVAGVSGLFVMSFGGQAVAAPLLLPFHIVFILSGSLPGAIGWVFLAWLLWLPAAWVYHYALASWGPLAVAGALAVGMGSTSLALLHRIRREREGGVLHDEEPS